MRYAFPPYDFFIVGGVTIILGYILRKTFFKNRIFPKKYVLVPYAIAFLPIWLVSGFVFDELPLKLYPCQEIIYDPIKSSGPSPQSISAEALKFLLLFYPSVLINLVLVGYAVSLLISYLISLRRRAS